jgi:hypothetical protein
MINAVPEGGSLPNDVLKLRIRPQQLLPLHACAGEWTARDQAEERIVDSLRESRAKRKVLRMELVELLVERAFGRPCEFPIGVSKPFGNGLLKRSRGVTPSCDTTKGVFTLKPVGCTEPRIGM